MGLFNLFGGKKKDEARSVKVEAAAVKTEAKPVAKIETKPAKPAKPSVPEPLGVSASGAAQVRLRLKLAQSLRTRRASAAYAAAKELAAIQAKAGRRLGARKWSEEAERIKASDPALKAA